MTLAHSPTPSASNLGNHTQTSGESFMAENGINLTKSELLQLLTAVAVLTEQVKTLSQKTERQDKILEELVALANQGRGSMWILVGLGGFVGAILGNLKAIATVLLR